jgi:hypothetical protein
MTAFGASAVHLGVVSIPCRMFIGALLRFVSIHESIQAPLTLVKITHIPRQVCISEVRVKGNAPSSYNAFRP